MMYFKNGSQPLLLSPTFGRTPYPTSVYAESIVLSFSLINPICLLQWVFVCLWSSFFGSVNKDSDSCFSIMRNVKGWNY